MTNELKKAVAAMGGVTAFARALGVDRTAAYNGDVAFQPTRKNETVRRARRVGETGREALAKAGDEAVK